MNITAFKATLLNVVSNALLFAVKGVVGLATGSIALISDAINSLNDLAAAVATFICVHISNKQADEGHPFGHSRAEPIAGLVIAILAGILGFEIIRESVARFLHHTEPEVTPLALLVPVGTMGVKAVLGTYFRSAGKETSSPALMATATDSFMDVGVSAAVLLGLLGVWAGYPFLDPAAALVVSLWVIYTGYTIGVENIDYLMGKSPPPELMEMIKEAAFHTEGVKEIGIVRAHYVGSYVHVEIHLKVDENLPTKDSHAISEEASRRVESLPSVDKSFIHIEPA